MVIPTLDEAGTLPELLPPLVAAAQEVIVSDGGSQDGTPELARSLGARVVAGGRGRGAQLNRGAAAATAPILLFLHADTKISREALEAAERAVAEGAEGGGFRVRFSSPSRLMAFGAGWINLRTRLCGWPLGDQAQFLARRVFEEMGGFPEWPILEDLELARRLCRRGRLRLVPLAVTTSARRFESQGRLRTVATNWTIWTLFFLGVSPARLARLYRPAAGRLEPRSAVATAPLAPRAQAITSDEP